MDSLKIATCVAVGLFGMAALSDAAQAREVVRFDGFDPGTIVVRTKERKLYYVDGPGRAIRYDIAVGMPGKEWAGTTTIGRKEVNPIWSPPAEVRRDKPSLPDLIPPGPANPLGPPRHGVVRHGIRHPRHQQALFDRHAGVLWLHPHVQRERRRALRQGVDRHARHRAVAPTGPALIARRPIHDPPRSTGGAGAPA